MLTVRKTTSLHLQFKWRKDSILISSIGIAWIFTKGDPAQEWQFLTAFVLRELLGGSWKQILQCTGGIVNESCKLIYLSTLFRSWGFTALQLNQLNNFCWLLQVHYCTYSTCSLPQEAPSPSKFHLVLTWWEFWGKSRICTHLALLPIQLPQAGYVPH